MRLEPVAERTAQHAAGGAGRPAFQHVVLAVEEICGIAWIEGHGRECWKRLELGARQLQAVWRKRWRLRDSRTPATPRAGESRRTWRDTPRDCPRTAKTGDARCSLWFSNPSPPDSRASGPGIHQPE